MTVPLRLQEFKNMQLETCATRISSNVKNFLNYDLNTRRE